MNITVLITALSPVVSAVLVAVLNNWDKINKNKKRVSEMYVSMSDLQKSVKEITKQINTISSAQRTSLQTTILEDCKFIQEAIDKGDIDYKEELKQLIILYREYYLCGYNSQGRLYFEDTISKVADDNNTLVHELMNSYFPEYNPHHHSQGGIKW